MTEQMKILFKVFDPESGENITETLAVDEFIARIKEEPDVAFTLGHRWIGDADKPLVDELCKVSYDTTKDMVIVTETVITYLDTDDARFASLMAQCLEEDQEENWGEMEDPLCKLCGDIEELNPALEIVPDKEPEPEPVTKD